MVGFICELIDNRSGAVNAHFPTDWMKIRSVNAADQLGNLPADSNKSEEGGHARQWEVNTTRRCQGDQIANTGLTLWADMACRTGLISWQSL